MKRASLFILCLVAASLACVIPVPSSDNTAIPGKTPTATRSIPATRLPEMTATSLAAVITAQSLHVRTAPYVPARGMYGTVIGYVYHDDAVTLTNKCSYGWAQIAWEDGTGWVNAKYLSESQCLTK